MKRSLIILFFLIVFSSFVYAIPITISNVTSNTVTNNVVCEAGNYCHIIADMVLYMPNDVSSTNVYDFTPNNNDGTYYLGALYSANGKYNGAMEFAGIDERVDIAETVSLESPADTDKITFIAWVNPDSITSNETAEDTVFYGEQLQVRFETSNDLEVCLVNETGAVANCQQADDVWTTGAWQMLSVVYNTSTFDIYRNDTLIATTASYAGLGIGKDQIACSAGYSLGSSCNVGGIVDWYDGKIDEVMIFNRSLSELEIAQVYNMQYPKYLSANQKFNLSVTANMINTTLNCTTNLQNNTNFGVAIQESGLIGEIQNITCGIAKNFSTTGATSLFNITVYYYTDPYGFWSPVLFSPINIVASYDYTIPVITSSCGTLSTANAIYELNQSVTSTGTCFTIGANNITLDCRGNTITYSIAGTLGYGVTTSYNYTVVKNCIIVEGNSATNQKHNIRYTGASYGTIYNNSLIAIGNTAYGIHLTGVTNYNTIEANNIWTNNTVGIGIMLQTGPANNNIISNNVTTTGAGGASSRAIHLSSSNSNMVYMNNLTTLGAAAVAMYVTSSDFNNITNNYFKTTGAGSVAVATDDVVSNIIHNNEILTTGTGLSYGFNIITASNFNNITNNDVTSSSNGIAITASDSNIVRDNSFITGNNDDARCLQFQTAAKYNQIIYNNFTNSALRGHCVYFSSSHLNNVSNDNCYIYGVTATGMYLIDSDENNLDSDNVYIYNTGTGIQFQTSPLNNTFSNMKVITNNTGQALYLYDASFNFTMKDSYLSSTMANVNDTYLRSTITWGIWNFTNVTRDGSSLIRTSWATANNATMNMHYYIDVFTNYTNFSIAPNVNITIQNNLGDQVYLGTTDANGLLKNAQLATIIYKGSTVEYSYFTVNASIGTEVYSTQVNLTTGNKAIVFTFNVTQCTPTWTNTSWGAWSNYTQCYLNNTIYKVRNLTTYDSTACNLTNTTMWEYGSDSCTYDSSDYLNLTIWDNSDDYLDTNVNVYVGDTANFFVTLQNLTGQNIVDGSCNLTISGNTYAMSYSAGRYRYSLQINSSGNYTYDVNCSRVDYGIINGMDNLSIQEIPVCTGDISSYFYPSSATCGEPLDLKIKDDTIGCDFDSSCWDNYDNVTASFPTGLSTLSDNPMNPRIDVTEEAWNIQCLSLGNYSVNATFQNETAKCRAVTTINITTYQMNPSITISFSLIQNVSIAQTYTVNISFNNTGTDNATLVSGILDKSQNNITLPNQTINISIIANGTSSKQQYSFTALTGGDVYLKIDRLDYYRSNGVYYNYAVGQSNTFHINYNPTWSQIPNVTILWNTFNDSMNLSYYHSDQDTYDNDENAIYNYSSTGNATVNLTVDKILNLTPQINFTGAINITLFAKDTYNVTVNTTVRVFVQNGSNDTTCDGIDGDGDTLLDEDYAITSCCNYESCEVLGSLICNNGIQKCENSQAWESCSSSPSSPDYCDVSLLWLQINSPSNIYSYTINEILLNISTYENATQCYWNFNNNPRLELTRSIINELDWLKYNNFTNGTQEINFYCNGHSNSISIYVNTTPNRFILPEDGFTGNLTFSGEINGTLINNTDYYDNQWVNITSEDYGLLAKLYLKFSTDRVDLSKLVIQNMNYSVAVNKKYILTGVDDTYYLYLDNIRNAGLVICPLANNLGEINVDCTYAVPFTHAEAVANTTKEGYTVNVLENKYEIYNATGTGAVTATVPSAIATSYTVGSANQTILFTANYTSVGGTLLKTGKIKWTIKNDINSENFYQKSTTWNCLDNLTKCITVDSSSPSSTYRTFYPNGTQAPSIPAYFNSEKQKAVGFDFNNDGIDNELALLAYNLDTSRRINIFSHNFSWIASSNSTEYAQYAEMIKLDYDGDGYEDDIALIKINAPMQIQIYTGNTTHLNKQPINPWVGSYARDLDKGDFDNDGKDDLIFVDSDGWEVRYGNGDTDYGAVSDCDDYATIQTGNINNDSYDDVIVECRSDSKNMVYFGSVSGLTNTGRILRTGSSKGYTVALGSSVSGSDLKDMAFYLAGNYLHYQQVYGGTANFDFYDWSSTVSSYSSTMGDFNGDGKDDLIITSTGGGYLARMYSINKDASNPILWFTLATAANMKNFYSSDDSSKSDDIDNDGIPEIIIRTGPFANSDQLFVIDATPCSILFNDTNQWTDMRYNSTLNTYIFNRTFSNNGTYFYNVSCIDSFSGYYPISQSGVISIGATADTTPPTISNLINKTTTNQSTYINWTTSESANFSLKWYNNSDRSTTYLVGTNNTNASSIDWSAYLSNLLNSTTYYINLTSCDSSGNCGFNNTFSFTTAVNTVGVTCTYDCSTNPSVGSVNCQGQNLILTGSGRFQGTITNYNNVSITGGCYGWIG